MAPEYVQIYPDEGLGVSARYVGPQFKADVYFYQNERSVGLWKVSGDALCRDLSGTVAAAVRKTPSLCPETVEIVRRIFDDYFTEIAALGHSGEPEAEPDPGRHGDENGL